VVIIDDLRPYGKRLASSEIPVPFLNSTIVETGEILVFTPVDVFGPEGKAFEGMKSFLDEYPGYDLDQLTAARMSATFPWVTPIARPTRDTDGPGYHLGDGGYFDNFGAVTLLEWLQSILPVYHSLGGTEILLIQVRASEPDRVDLEELKKERGWMYATTGPLQALLKARVSTQHLRKEREADLLEALLATGDNVRLVRAEFTLSAPAPLSWKLSNDERRGIAEAWRDAKVGSEFQKVEDFFRGCNKSCPVSPG